VVLEDGWIVADHGVCTWAVTAAKSAVGLQGTHWHMGAHVTAGMNHQSGGVSVPDSVWVTLSLRAEQDVADQIPLSLSPASVKASNLYATQQHKAGTAAKHRWSRPTSLAAG
jgi:hypothetical protein